MKKINSITVEFLLFIFITGCAGYTKTSEKFEGVSGDQLKITISEFFPFEENLSAESVKTQVRTRLDQRAMLVMASYISINLPRNRVSDENDRLLNDHIRGALNSGRMISFECNEYNHCSAHGEYNIASIQSILKSDK